MKSLTKENSVCRQGISLLWVCDEVWVFGDEITEGMKKEIIFAEKLNIKVKYISEKELKKTEVI